MNAPKCIWRPHSPETCGGARPLAGLKGGTLDKEGREKRKGKEDGKKRGGMGNGSSTKSHCEMLQLTKEIK